MTTLVLSTAAIVATAKPKIRALRRQIANALDAFARAQVRQTVSERQLRKAQRDIGRYSRMMHTDSLNQRGRKSQTKYAQLRASTASLYR